MLGGRLRYLGLDTQEQAILDFKPLAAGSALRYLGSATQEPSIPDFRLLVSGLGAWEVACVVSLKQAILDFRLLVAGPGACVPCLA